MSSSNLPHHKIGTFPFWLRNPIECLFCCKEDMLYIQAYLVLPFYRALLYCVPQIYIYIYIFFFFFFLTNWRFVATLCWTSLWAPFFQQQWLTSCPYHILVILTVFQTSLLLQSTFGICGGWVLGAYMHTNIHKCSSALYKMV